MIQTNKRKLLITGISGFLGNCFAKLPQQDWEIIGVYHNNLVEYPGVETIKADLSSEASVNELFATTRPDAVIHLAALSNPNYCEQHPANSKKVNVDLAVQMANHCQQKSIPFIFTSTDLVFDGNHAPYDEEAEPQPVNVYGKHKAMAEKEILKVYPAACIVRCPVMYGIPDWGNSFMKSWLNNLKQEKNVYAFTDEFRTKVSGNDAVEGLLLLLNKEAKGIWHLGGKERISRYDFAIKMAETFSLPTGLVKASKQADVKMPAARPSNVSLNSNKAFNLGYNPTSITKALKILKEKLPKS